MTTPPTWDERLQAAARGLVNAKTTRDETIRQAADAGVPKVRIAESTGLSRPQIYAIINTQSSRKDNTMTTADQRRNLVSDAAGAAWSKYGTLPQKLEAAMRAGADHIGISLTGGADMLEAAPHVVAISEINGEKSYRITVSSTRLEGTAGWYDDTHIYEYHVTRELSGDQKTYQPDFHHIGTFVADLLIPENPEITSYSHRELAGDY